LPKSWSGSCMYRRFTAQMQNKSSMLTNNLWIQIQNIYMSKRYYLEVLYRVLGCGWHLNFPNLTALTFLLLQFVADHFTIIIITIQNEYINNVSNSQATCVSMQIWQATCTGICIQMWQQKLSKIYLQVTNVLWYVHVWYEWNPWSELVTHYTVNSCHLN
jgi:hypothetical protein